MSEEEEREIRGTIERLNDEAAAKKAEAEELARQALVKEKKRTTLPEARKCTHGFFVVEGVTQCPDCKKNGLRLGGPLMGKLNRPSRKES